MLITYFAQENTTKCMRKSKLPHLELFQIKKKTSLSFSTNRTPDDSRTIFRFVSVLYTSNEQNLR